MRKEIDFAPYDEAEIKGIYEDGGVLCDLYGDGHSDRDILFPEGSPVLTLTEQEWEQFRAERAAAEKEALEALDTLEEAEVPE